MLTLQDPHLPRKRQQSAGTIKLYQTLQDYIYVRAEFDTMQISGSCFIAGWQGGRNRLI